MASPLTISPDAVATLVERLAQNALTAVRAVTPDLCPSETSGPAALQRPEPRPTERTFDR